MKCCLLEGECDKNKHPSPKGRRLPAPPPEDAMKSSVEDQARNSQVKYLSVESFKGFRDPVLVRKTQERSP